MSALVLVAVAWTMAAAAWQADPAAPRGSPQERFRSGVDLVQLDVSVLDREGRPVRGLTADDFTIVENGRPQEILAFTVVDVPPPSTPHARWMRDVAPDVVSNAQDTRRVVVIVMDDAYTGFEHGESTSARRIARAIVDELGPADMAAVVFTHLGKNQTFTTHRAKLLEAVASFVPRNSVDGPTAAGPPLRCQMIGCALETLTRVAEFLKTAPPGRKIVAFIGAAGLKISGDPESPLRRIQDLFRNLQQANVTVNVFDPSGLQTLAPVARDYKGSDASGRWQARLRNRDGLRALAENTGGRAFLDTNAPEAYVQELFQQNSAYYLLGFDSSDPTRDGRFRKIQVRVDRPDVTVRTRSGYFAPPQAERRSPQRVAWPVDAALARGMPAKELPVQMQIARFAIPGRREVAVAVTAGVWSQENSSGPDEVVAAAFDAEWRERGRYRQTVELPAPTGAGIVYDRHASLPLRPGRYEIRLAVEAGGRAGSVFTSVDVPDPSRRALWLSDLVLTRSPAQHPNPSALAGLLPGLPTTVRDFGPAEKVSAFLRIYQGGRQPLVPVALTTRLVNDRGEMVLQDATSVQPDRFLPHRAADHQVELPLSRLGGGDYLLTVEAAAGERREIRAIRLGMRPRLDR